MYIPQPTQQISPKDIKILSTHPNILATAGRNNDITLLHATNKTTIKTITLNSYINSSIFAKINDSLAYIVGCQNGAIIIYKNILDDAKPVYLLSHSQNVCALDVKDNLLVNASWDGKIKVWDLLKLTEIQNIEVGCCVWSIKFYNNYDFIAGCADKKIRVYVNGEVKKVLECNLSAVRGISIYKTYIYSIGNDGKIMKMRMGGRLCGVFDVKDFLYSVCVERDRVLVCGENGKVVVLDGDLSVVWKCKVDATSCWCGLFVGDEIVVGGSNGKLYTFKYTDEVNEEKSRGVEDINEKSKTGSCGVIRKDSNYKIENGKVYMFENNTWNLIGDVADDKQYDHSFDVEVDGKYLKINFNDGEDVFEIADKFLKTHNLQSEYKDDIVEFIRKNFKLKEGYFMYKDINVSGITKYLDDSLILENLKNPNKENNKEIEKRLKELLKNEENFYVLDCYRYFVAHGFVFDFVFLQDYKTDDKKSATVFMRLLVNLYVEQPFNLEIFKGKVARIVDYKLVDEGTIDKFRKNRELSNK